MDLSFINENNLKKTKENILDSDTCKLCKKLFKTKKSRDRHQKFQLCKPISERTYCKYCDFTTNDKKIYKKHLISIEHLNKINTIISSSDNEKNNNFTNDKKIFLEKKEVKTNLETIEIHRKNLIIPEKKKVSTAVKKVNKITNDLNLQKNIEIQNQKNLAEKKKKEIEKKQKIDNYDKHYLNEGSFVNHYISEPKNKLSYNDILKAEMNAIPEKTQYQTKICDFLVNIKDKNISEKEELFKKILKLINLDDTNYLLSHIRTHPDLSINDKQIYMNIIDKFILKLIEIMNNGYETLGGKKIQDIIIRISK